MNLTVYIKRLFLTTFMILIAIQPSLQGSQQQNSPSTYKHVVIPAIIAGVGLKLAYLLYKSQKSMIASHPTSSSITPKKNNQFPPIPLALEIKMLQQAEQRQHNLKKKEIFCQDLQEMIRQTDAIIERWNMQCVPTCQESLLTVQEHIDCINTLLMMHDERSYLSGEISEYESNMQRFIECGDVQLLSNKHSLECIATSIENNIRIDQERIKAQNDAAEQLKQQELIRQVELQKQQECKIGLELQTPKICATPFVNRAAKLTVSPTYVNAIVPAVPMNAIALHQTPKTIVQEKSSWLTRMWEYLESHQG